MRALHPPQDDGERARSAGSVGRRRPIPTGRALAGGFFVALAVVIVMAGWLAGTSSAGRRFVVAARTLPAGATLGPGDLATASMTLPDGSTARLAFSDPAPLVGRVLAGPLRAGELVQAGDVAAAPSTGALRPVTVDVTPSDLSALSTGALVDVLVTDGTDPSSPTSLVVAGARVLDLGRPSSSLVGGSSGAELTIGVATLTQVTAVVHAAHTGTLSVVAGMPGDVPTTLPPATPVPTTVAPAPPPVTALPPAAPPAAPSPAAPATG